MTYLAATNGLFQTALPLQRLQPYGVPPALQMNCNDLQAITTGFLSLMAFLWFFFVGLQVLTQFEHC